MGKKESDSPEEFERGRAAIKDIYSDLEKAAKMNPDIYLMPTELYNKILKKLGHTGDRIIKQTGSLKRHLKEKQAQRRKIKELEAKIRELNKKITTNGTRAS